VALQGVNVVLAPVADLNTAGTDGAIGNRSYGEDPQVVADMVRAAVGGLQDAGVAAAVKHWPGHGATEVDSHLSLPVLDITRTAWEERERVPFQAAIDEGVDIVLVGHLALPELDPAGDPATVSPVLIEELLRQQLGFDGVVMTDALNMGAVADIERGDLVVEAVAAGADILLVPPDLAVAYNAVIQAVESGRLPEERIDQAARRVLVLKNHLGLLPTVE
jgi:beta-N-acetylhexosaminidase